MKNVTLSADDHLIEQARRTAKAQHKTLNQAFREWLESYTQPDRAVDEYEALMKRLNYVQAGRKFTREEMNER
jgi:ferric-dicitrate binding protein FerR (iron transport regulator)